MVSSEALWPVPFQKLAWWQDCSHSGPVFPHGIGRDSPPPPTPQNVAGTLILERSYGHCYPASHADFWLIQIPDIEREGLSKYYLSQATHL